jgi:ABC-type transporter Mla MlaB component
MKKSAEEAALNCENLLTLLKELNEGNNTRFKEMMAEAQKQSRQQQELMMQQIERNNSTYIAMFQKQNEQFNKQQAHIMKLILGMANRPVIVEGGGGECTLI